MKKSKKKRIKTILNPTLAQKEELANDFIGHPGPATTIAAHQRRAIRHGKDKSVTKGNFTQHFFQPRWAQDETPEHLKRKRK